MVIARLSIIACIFTSGYIMTADTYWGAGWAEGAHTAFGYAALGLIFFHVLGVRLARMVHRENLVRAMITVWKRRA